MTKLSVSTWAPVSKNNQWAEDWREEAASPDSSFSEFRWRNWGEQVPCRTEGSFGVEMGPICVDLCAQRERQRTLKISTKCPKSGRESRVGDGGALEGLHLIHRAGQDEYIFKCRLSQWGWSLKLLSTMEAISHISHVSLPQTERFSKGQNKTKQTYWIPRS